ncbi:hypothetical protein CPB86DRAFT_699034 [Serendipita vermifera]|nr:hypothetical protein CPB86DRAFT_699034 [Serendipita vermifera]
MYATPDTSQTYTQPQYNQHPTHCPECVQADQSHPCQSPRPLRIISPSGQEKTMIFVERVSHITAQVEYGLVPADPKLRKYDARTGAMVGNEGMELLSPRVFEDTPRGMFFFAERRPVPKEEGEQEAGTNGQLQIVRNSRWRRMASERSLDESPQKKKIGTTSSIPTLLEQLVRLKVLRIVPTVRCRSIEHGGACLVHILLSNSEIAHACYSPKHTYFLYEAPGYTRFKVCTACRSVPYRRGVYFCSEACMAARWPQHRIECGKTREQLEHMVSILPTIIHSGPLAPAHNQSHRPIWHRAWLWMNYVAHVSKENMVDLAEWKAHVRERNAHHCKDMLPGF